MVKALQALAAGTNRRYGRSHREVIDPFAVANPTWRAASRKRPYTTRCAASSDLGKGARQTVCVQAETRKKLLQKINFARCGDLRHARPHTIIRQALASGRALHRSLRPGGHLLARRYTAKTVDEPALANQL